MSTFKSSAQKNILQSTPIVQKKDRVEDMAPGQTVIDTGAGNC